MCGCCVRMFCADVLCGLLVVSIFVVRMSFVRGFQCGF